MNKEQVFDLRVKEHFTSGINKSLKKDYRGAIEELNQALRLDPNNAEAYGNRSVARYKIGDKRRAFEDCKRATVLYLRQGKMKQYQYALKMQKKLALSV